MPKSKTAPLITAEELTIALDSLNLLFNAASGSLPPGLVPTAKEAQIRGLQEAGQSVVTLLEAHGPAADVSPLGAMAEPTPQAERHH